MKRLTLEQRIERLERLINEAAIDGAELIHKDDDWKVYKVTAYPAAKKFSRGTDWGYSGNWDEDSYRTNGVWSGEELFNKDLNNSADGAMYFYISKGGKYCLIRKGGNKVVISDEDYNLVDPKKIFSVEANFPAIEGVFVPKDLGSKEKLVVQLYNAIYKNNIEAVKKLIDKGVDLEKPHPTEKGGTPLKAAIFNKCYNIAKLLLDAGANPDGTGGGNPKFYSPMSAAAGAMFVNKDSRYVDLLKKYGSKLDPKKVW